MKKNFEEFIFKPVIAKCTKGFFYEKSAWYIQYLKLTLEQVRMSIRSNCAERVGKMYLLRVWK